MAGGQISRSENMRRIRSKDTKPEMLVRRLAHKMGYRYRLHRRDLPGKPDLVFGPRRKVIFVHGCFWHSHSGPNCPDRRQPRSNLAYWQPKLARNQRRDAEHMAALAKAGWEVLIVWECETRNPVTLAASLRAFLDRGKPQARAPAP
ncbi:MAG TPA: very short patch repair endonuclease [Methylocella sp.]|nr:very short patch repair endonuclease [Methylocella sp.]